jgi:hypothetical protein
LGERKNISIICIKNWNIDFHILADIQHCFESGPFNTN